MTVRTMFHCKWTERRETQEAHDSSQLCPQLLPCLPRAAGSQGQKGPRMLPAVALRVGGWAMSPRPHRFLLLTAGAVGCQEYLNPWGKGKPQSPGQIPEWKADILGARQHRLYHQSKHTTKVKIMINRYHWTLIPVRFPC